MSSDAAWGRPEASFGTESAGKPAPSTGGAGIGVECAGVLALSAGAMGMSRSKLRDRKRGQAHAVKTGRIGLVAIALLTGCAWARGEGDSVLWSDGRTWSGAVTMGGDGRLPLHDGKVVRPIPLAEITRIAWHIETQRMERAWTFVEAGRTEKRFTGDPYPTRQWSAVVTLANGETVAGQLISTVFYLEDEAGSSRLVVKSKQRGKEGERFEDVAGVVEIRFGGSGGGAGPVGTATRVRVAGAPLGIELGVATLNPTQAAGVRREDDGSFTVALNGTRVVASLRVGNRVRVGWPGESQGAGPAPSDAREADALTARLQAALPHVRDFFDERRIVAVARDPSDPERCHSLMLLLREGQTTLGGPRPNPWHVEVWTWRLGEKDGILFESRAILVRDRRSAGDPLPDVVLDAAVAAPESWGAAVELAWK